ncbi:MAG: hypothetical protein RL701_6970, partial [Pseudomonadota bacterium]
MRDDVSLTRLGIGLLELALAGASVYLAVRLSVLLGSEREAFLSKNTLPAPQRMTMLLSAFAAGLLPLALGVFAYLRSGKQAVRAIVRAGELCSPWLLSCFVPALLDYDQWYDKPLPYLVQLLAFVVVLERLLMRAIGTPSAGASSYAPLTTGVSTRWSRTWPFLLVLLFGCGYAAYMSYYTVMRHQLMGTAGFDLGIFDNLMFNAMHGRPFRSTVAVPHGSYLSNHAEYGMFLFVPLYALHPSADTLLVLQSTFIGLAAVPLYLFCSTQITRPSAAALSIAYLFYAPLHGPNFYDFHWMPMAMFFFHWLFYAIAKRNV